jgi:predicted transcriptional regulator of viral defense system
MKYGSLVESVGGMAWFDLPLLVQGFDEPRENIRLQLSRWMTQGKVVGLRRGMYALPEAFRRAPLSGAALANQLYRPSYLSGLWALAFYDLIPERVTSFTSITSRVPRHFENPAGVFDYRNIKQDAFFGYRADRHGEHEIFVAEPEKALLDHWHLTSGEWTPARLAEMRYQHADRIADATLMAYVERFRSPRLRRAATRWVRLMEHEEKGTVTL